MESYGIGGGGYRLSCPMEWYEPWAIGGVGNTP